MTTLAFRRRAARVRPYLLSHIPDCSEPEAPAAPLLRRVLAGLRALPDHPPVAPPVAGWKCMVAECLWESINPMSHPCPFPPASAERTGTLAALVRRLPDRDPSLGAPPEQRDPSPDVVRTRELPVIGWGGAA